MGESELHGLDRQYVKAEQLLGILTLFGLSLFHVRSKTNDLQRSNQLQANSMTAPTSSPLRLSRIRVRRRKVTFTSL